MSLRIRRGTNTQRTGGILDQGELGYTTDTKKLYIGDGVSYGGKNVVAECAGIGLSWNETTQTLNNTVPAVASTTNVAEGTNLYHTTERAQDAAASLFIHTDHSAISFSYNDNLNKIVANVVNPFPANATGFLKNNGSGTYSWETPAFQLQSDTAPILGGNLALNGKNITGIGTINVTGGITGTILTAGSYSITNSTVTVGSNATLRTNVNKSRQYCVVDGTGTDHQAGSFGVSATKGTLASPIALTANEYIGSIILQTYYEASYQTVGLLTAQLSSTLASLSPGSKPEGNLQLLVYNNTVGGHTKFTFDYTGTFSAPVIRPGVYADATARDTAIVAPLAGMIVYLTATSKFTGYVDDAGSAAPGWVNLN